MRPARTALWLRLAVALGLALVGPLPVGWSSARAPIYVSSWAVRVSQGYREAERLARKFGFVYLGQIFPDGQYFHLRHRGVVQQSLTPHWGHCLRLKKDPKVQWFEQQTLRRRVKRSLVVPTDPWFPKQWYMNNKVQPDLNILQVWSQGLSGQGVVVSVLDDGIEKDHPDLWANYDPLASYDFNDYDPDPQPRYTPSDENRHGTRCAGEVAAMANNGFCGTGVAYNARIGGVRMLDGTITDVIEAQSLSLQPQHIHIYSASWGPEDDGRTVDGPGILTREAFRRGVTKGRGGLGTLFVWASGNGGLHYDNCNCDGYTNSIHTLSVGSTTEHGRVPWYSEACASTLTTTYSSGVATDPQIVTTDLHHQCTDKHTGTSASAPLAAGMIALALEANPFLTWRDMQHLVVRASRPAQLQAEDWRTNGVGRQGEARPGGGGATAMGRVMTTPPHSEPPLWLWAAGRQAAGGHGSNVAAHTTPAEMRRSDRPHPHPHPAADASEEERVGLRGPRQLHPLPGARAGAAVSVLQPPGGPGDLAHQPHGHPLHARGHQTLGHQRPRLQQLDLHVHPLLGRGPAGPVDPGPGKQRLLFQHGDAVPLHAAALRDGRGHDGAAPGPPGDQQRVRAAGHRGAVPGMPQLRLHPGPPLPFLLPSEVLQAHPAGGDRRAWAPGHTRAARLLQLPRLLLPLPRRLAAQLHRLSPVVLAALPAATWGPPRRWGHPHHPPRSSCCLEPRDI
ncbi:proprotein convertase subtilisin/kexin type 4 isoform X11 [Vulpes lagopus]|uniref:proprotein convertase subtilisin/kexin type 4 isoform X11 n=1 Tax=Vulpes lagopus TaxID=494514 RepID=UPI001BC939F5|nr:proprotein convertase subtilisin/kexin type 4 isoform X11 [Vulpes lagopus]